MTVLEAKGVNGTITFDGVTVSFIRNQRAGLLPYGTRTIPLDAITGVRWMPPGVLGGYLALDLPGSPETRARWGSRIDAALRDENAVVFGARQVKPMKAVCDAIQLAIANRGRLAPAQAPAVNVGDRLDELQRLLADGHITPTEFDLFRREILRQL